MNNWRRPNKPELDATEVPSELEIAWAAGFYEGEGSCRNAGHSTRGFMVSLPQKNEEPLFWMRNWFGGNVGKPNKNGIRVWECCGDRARIFVALIYSTLTTRRKEQIDETGVFEFLDGRSPIGIATLELQRILLDYYEREREIRSSPTAKKRREQKRSYYLRKAADPVWVAAKNERQRNRWKNQQEQQKVEPPNNLVAIA